MRLESFHRKVYSFLEVLINQSAGHIIPGASSTSSLSMPTTTVHLPTATYNSLLLARQQNNVDCSASASRSATEAIRQASQSASQAIQQASQSAIQQIQQATISASNAIRDAQNTASQSVAQASRSSSSIASSASSAVASLQRSADQAIASAKNDASSAVLRAEIIVAAATGSNAAAGSLILEQIARKTGVSGSGNNNDQAKTGPGLQVSATQAALAIVSSIFVSVLLCLLGFFFIQRNRRKKELKSRLNNASPWQPDFFEGNGPQVPSEDVPPTRRLAVNTSENTKLPNHSAQSSTSTTVSLSLFPKTPTTPQHLQLPSYSKNEVVGASSTDNQRKSLRQGKWLRAGQPLSPFGAISLSTKDEDRNLPLGGQLKSPLTSIYPHTSNVPSPPIKEGRKPPTPGSAPRDSRKALQVRPNENEKEWPPREQTPRDRRKARSVAHFIEEETRDRYAEAKANVWTIDSPRPDLPSSSQNRVASQKAPQPSRSNERSNDDAIRTTELEWTVDSPINKDMATPDTGVLRSAKVGTAVQGRVVLPSLSGGRRQMT